MGRQKNVQAFNHTLIILLTRPTLKILITRDITQHISNDMKNESMMFASKYERTLLQYIVRLVHIIVALML